MIFRQKQHHQVISESSQLINYEAAIKILCKNKKQFISLHLSHFLSFPSNIACSPLGSRETLTWREGASDVVSLEEKTAQFQKPSTSMGVKEKSTPEIAQPRMTKCDFSSETLLWPPLKNLLWSMTEGACFHRPPAKTKTMKNWIPEDLWLYKVHLLQHA